MSGIVARELLPEECKALNIDHLEALGFFRHVPAADREPLRRRMIEAASMFDALGSTLVEGMDLDFSGRHSCDETRLVAFSCNGRGFCPSCLGRKMSATAAHLIPLRGLSRIVEDVLPAVDLRQWVLTVPFAWRKRLGYEGRLVSELTRIFATNAPPPGVTATVHLDPDAGFPHILACV